MKKITTLLLLLFCIGFIAKAQRTTINLNGTWDFEQTETAFPPKEFTRKIPVPGLITLARPKIEQYNKLLIRPETVDYESEHLIENRAYDPMYNWYRLRVKIPAKLKDKHAVLTLLKSKYVTQIFVNGKDAGSSMECFTPIDVPVTDYLEYGKENEILIRVGDRAWLPSAAAGDTDKEKMNYIPGIWDNVFLSFTNNFRVHRALLLPSVKKKNVTAKLMVRSFYPSQSGYGDQMQDTVYVKVSIHKGENGSVVNTIERPLVATRDNLTKFEAKIPIPNAHRWTPDDPFRYMAEIRLIHHGNISDRKTELFGMRDFGRDGKLFTLNGKKTYLRGGNITLHRFFEDPDAGALPWNRKWVEKLLGTLPKKMNWNAMRICVGIAPSMWYDVADSMGIMLQNEWMYWQDHGWNEEIRKEYSDWVWADGSHPSIIIWDAINENWNDYVGQRLIPDLKQLDPTRIWDAGYMTGNNMSLNEMDEPHLYQVYGMHDDFNNYYMNHPYPLGDLDYQGSKLNAALTSSAAQLVNEYGWMWLWRDGTPAKLMKYSFPFYLGRQNTTEQRRYLQAYWEQLQTEWIRSHRAIGGDLAFCYLTNNYGYTGDWFVGDIKDLTPGPAMNWFAHAFSPAAVFVDITDERYVKPIANHEPGSDLSFNLVGVNDYDHSVSGEVTVKLLDNKGKQAGKTIAQEITIPAQGKKLLPTSLQLPKVKGGYLVLAKYQSDTQTEELPVISRRFINIGKLQKYSYFNYTSQPLEDK